MYGQYSISGYLNTKEKGKTIYLSLLKYNEENAIYPAQVLIRTKTDSSGYFKITGKLLAQENMLYRIHSNHDDNDTAFEFRESGPKKNYHNFIFSNNDTIYFNKDNGVWFSSSQNTNSDDKQWRKSIKYEQELLKEFIKTENPEAKKQSKMSFLNEFKLFCNDSLSGPLVKLLAFSHIKRNSKNLSEDFSTDPDFYYELSDNLNKYYSGTSYYSQFQEEISKLSASETKQKYLLHKKLNYLLSIVIILLITSVIFLIRKQKKINKQKVTEVVSNLTTQEDKIAKLICKGMSNKEIASKLFISMSTVKSHIRHLYSKSNVSNRQELIEKLKNHTRD